MCKFKKKFRPDKYYKKLKRKFLRQKGSFFKMINYNKGVCNCELGEKRNIVKSKEQDIGAQSNDKILQKFKKKKKNA